MSNKAANKSNKQSLSKNAQKFLRGIGHDTKPVVTIADKGITENILNELEVCLNQHELIKVKIRADRETRSQFITDILDATDAHKIQAIGQTLTIFRANPKKPVFELPR